MFNVEKCRRPESRALFENELLITSKLVTFKRESRSYLDFLRTQTSRFSLPPLQFATNL